MLCSLIVNNSMKSIVTFETLTENLMNSESDIDVSVVIVKIDTVEYQDYELLFKKRLTNYTIPDENNYKQILLRIYGNRCHYKDKQIEESKLRRKKKLVHQWLQKRNSFGSGTNNTDYVLWDDPNEWVRKLKLLITSTSAGHTGHTK